MSKDTKLIVEELSLDLATKNIRLMSVNRLILAWLSFFVAAASILMTWRAPFRSNVFEQLAASPHFVFEMIVGSIACMFLTIGAIQSSVPGYSALMGRIGMLASALWVGSIAMQLIYPAVLPSMHGKREHCYWEVFYYSVPAGLAMVWLINRRYPLEKIINAAFSGFAVAIVPAMLMQYACMYEARHALTHHLLPAVVGGTLIAFVVWFSGRFFNNRNAHQ